MAVDKKAEIYFKNTGIRITCETSEEAFQIYWDMGHRPGFVINGEELQQKGPTKEPNSYFAGYTRGFFEKYFEDKEKDVTMDKYAENLESLQRRAEEKGLYVDTEDSKELEP